MKNFNVSIEKSTNLQLEQLESLIKNLDSTIFMTNHNESTKCLLDKELDNLRSKIATLKEQLAKVKQENKNLK